MTDLDHVIAKLKHYDAQAVDAVRLTNPEVPPAAAFFCWSSNDAKALELVDEFPDAGFMLCRFGSRGGEYQPWQARFTFRRPGVPDSNIEQHARTRPEAICYAYLAAREWMAAQRPTDPELRAKMRTMRDGPE